MTNTTCSRSGSKKKEKEKGATENNLTELETSAATTEQTQGQTRTGTDTQSTGPQRPQPLLLPDKPRERVVLSGMGAVTRKVEQIHVCKENEDDDKDEDKDKYGKNDNSDDNDNTKEEEKEENIKGGMVVRVLVGVYVAKAAVFMCKGTVNTKRLFVQDDTVEVLCPQSTAIQEAEADTDTGADVDRTDGTSATGTAGPSVNVEGVKKVSRRRKRRRKRVVRREGGYVEKKVAVVVKKSETGKAKMYCREVGEILPALEHRGDIWKVFVSRKTGWVKGGDGEHLCLCVEPVDGSEVWIEEKLVHSIVEEVSWEGRHSADNSGCDGKERSGLDEANTGHKQQQPQEEQERSQMVVEEEADGSANNRNSEQIEHGHYLDKCESYDDFCYWRGGGGGVGNEYENTSATTNTERSEVADSCYNVGRHESVWKCDVWWKRGPSEELWNSTPGEEKRLSTEWMNTPYTVTAAISPMSMPVRREGVETEEVRTERRRWENSSNTNNRDKDNSGNINRESLNQTATHFCWHYNYNDYNCDNSIISSNSDNCLQWNYDNNRNNNNSKL